MRSSHAVKSAPKTVDRQMRIELLQPRGVSSIVVRKVRYLEQLNAKRRPKLLRAAVLGSVAASYEPEVEPSQLGLTSTVGRGDERTVGTCGGERPASAVAIGDTGYALRHGYAEAVAGFASTRWDWPDFPISDTRVLPDVMTGIIEILRVSTEPGNTVIVTTPVHAPFFSYISHADRIIAEAPLTPPGRLNIESIGDAIARVQASGRRCVVLLCNPHNPTGTVRTRSELESLARVARDAGIRGLSDEIHGPLVLAGATFIPYLTVTNSEKHERVHLSVQGVEPCWAQGCDCYRRA
ncbi:hypothetical protein ABIE52_000115 [Rhodococcus sp. OAS809]